MYGDVIFTLRYISLGTSGNLQFCLIRETNLTPVYVIMYNGETYGETKLLDSPVITFDGLFKIIDVKKNVYFVYLAADERTISIHVPNNARGYCGLDPTR